MKYKTDTVKAKQIEAILQSVGIEYKSTYIPSSVPCQTKVEIEMMPKNALESLACIGVVR